MVSNSLLAYASVNHLHYHFLYLNYPTLARRVVSQPVSSNSHPRPSRLQTLVATLQWC